MGYSEGERVYHFPVTLHLHARALQILVDGVATVTCISIRTTIISPTKHPPASPYNIHSLDRCGDKEGRK
jgi:hypothetical protein